MKNFLKPILFLYLFFSAMTAFPQQTDSLSYQLQREKVNDLLAKRSIKFNQYFQSLDRHTGIFGLQTKKDIRRSNEILMEIVNADNAVFKELKVLLDYRTTVQTEAQNQSKEAGDRNISFMTTINKLRSQTKTLRDEADDYQKSADHFKNLLIGSLLLILLLAFVIIRLKSSKGS